MAVNGGTSTRLNTWKEIAAHLGRDERTAKRWEATRSLPVRRVPGGRSTVFAYAYELDAWLARGNAEAEPVAAPDAPPVVTPATSTVAVRTDRSPRWRLAPLAAGVALVLTVVVTRPSAAPRRVAPAAAAPAPELYLQGVYAWNTRTRAGLTDAIADFSRVILDHPGYAPAYAGLADCYNLMPEYGGMGPAEAYPQAKVAALRAVALDDRLAGAHRALGFVDFWWSHDVAASRREFSRALALDPDAAPTHHWYGNTLAMTGDAKAAIAELDVALRLDPASTAIRADRANALFIAGRQRDALDQLEAVASARPDFAPTFRYLSIWYAALGDAPRAVAAMSGAALASGDPREATVASAARRGLTDAGAAGAARAVLAARRAQYDRGEGSPYLLARSEAAVDPAVAVGLLETSAARGRRQSWAWRTIRLSRRSRPMRASTRSASGSACRRSRRDADRQRLTA